MYPTEISGLRLEGEAQGVPLGKYFGTAAFREVGKAPLSLESYDRSSGFVDALRGKMVGSGMHRESELLRKVVAPVLSLVLPTMVCQHL